MKRLFEIIAWIACGAVLAWLLAPYVRVQRVAICTVIIANPADAQPHLVTGTGYIKGDTLICQIK